MLLDWVTINIPVEHFSDAQIEVLLGLNDRILRVCAQTGEVVYETVAWDVIRSDSHQLNARFSASGGLWLMGSPARVIGDGCAVFGSGASAALNIGACIDAMRLFMQQALKVNLPSDISLYRVTRIDVTENLWLPDLTAVRQALTIMRGINGGRYRVSSTAGETVYWSQKSTLRSGKAYAKGPHLLHLKKQKTYTGRDYSAEDIDVANHLLRLELKLGREFFNRTNWRTFTADDLREQWRDYFMRMIGDSEIKNDGDLKTRIFAAAPTEGLGKAAFGLWTLIKSQGWEEARDMTSTRTWYRGLKTLRAAGLSDADISSGQVVAFRQKVIEAQVVTSWSQLRALCA